VVVVVCGCAEKPGKPEPPAITSTGKSTVSLSYKPPADDGGAPITNYVIEHREEGLAKWTRATKVRSRRGTGSHFVTQRPCDRGIQRPGDPVDPVTLFYNELQMSTYVW